jgi:hypothetical protein
VRRRIIFALLLSAGIGYRAMSASEIPVHLDVSSERLAQLRALRDEAKFLDLPGAPAAEERRRLEPLINSLLDRLVAGVQGNPTDLWVLEQMDSTVDAFHLEDTEARERCIAYLDGVFKILGMPNDRGAFRKYMIIW